MSEADLRRALDPGMIIENRKTDGGPQKTEPDKAIARTDAVITANRQWVKNEADDISAALARLDRDSSAYLSK